MSVGNFHQTNVSCFCTNAPLVVELSTKFKEGGLAARMIYFQINISQKLTIQHFALQAILYYKVCVVMINFDTSKNSTSEVGKTG